VRLVNFIVQLWWVVDGDESWRFNNMIAILPLPGDSRKLSTEIETSRFFDSQWWCANGGR